MPYAGPSGSARERQADHRGVVVGGDALAAADG